MKQRSIQPTPVFRRAILIAGVMMAWQISAKAARDSLFLAVFPPTSLPGAIGAAAVCSILMAFLSARLLRRFGPFKLVPWLYVGGALLHAAEWTAISAFPRAAAAFIYLHVMALGPVLLSGFWTLASEQFDPREARQRFGQIMAFGTIGSLAGGLAAERISSAYSAAELLIFLAVLQALGSVVLFRFAPAGAQHKHIDTPSFPEVISGAPYLVSLGLFVLLVAMSAGTLDYLFKTQAVNSIGRGKALTRFFALFYAGVSVITFVVQAGLSKFWLKRFGPGRTVAALPAAVTGASIFSILFPLPIALMVSRGLEQLLRGSLFRSGYELFYTPMPQSEKRSAKSVIDIGADRLGDGLAAATIQLLIVLPPQMSYTVILGLTAALSAAAWWLAFRLDRAYVSVLEKGLANHTVVISPDEAEDLLTKSVVLRTMSIAAPVTQPGPHAAGAPLLPADPVLRKLAEIRSGDVARILAALRPGDPLEPAFVPDVIHLLGRDDIARLAHQILTKHADRVTGQLLDCLRDKGARFEIRKRIPRILGACDNRLAWDGLLQQVSDDRFEIRYRCGRALENILTRHPEYKLEADVIFEIVTQELVASSDLLRKRLSSGVTNTGRLQLMDDVLRERATQTLAHICTLFALVLPPQSVRLAFRALRTDNDKLRGVALEYLESVLPRPLWEQLSAHFEGRVTIPRDSQKQASAASLFDSSPSIAKRLEELGASLPELEEPGRGATAGE